MLFELEITPDEKEFSDSLEKDLSAITEQVVKDVVRQTPIEMWELIAGSPATGRRYGSHVASSEGNPPRNRSGALSGSIEGKLTGKDSGEVSLLWYGAFHDENGRPFIERAFTDALEKAI